MSKNEPTAGEARNIAFKNRSASSVTARIARAILRHDDTGLFADFPNHYGDKSKGPISPQRACGLAAAQCPYRYRAS